MKCVWLAALLLLACGDHGERGNTSKTADPSVAQLGGDVAAKVGSETVPVALVAKIATAQKIPARDALRRVLDDAIAAESAKSDGLDRVVPASWLLVAARARFTADHLQAEARAKGPPTDDEVKRLSALHWREVDRPPAVRVVHALVMRPKAPNNADLGPAKALAAAIHDAVVAAPSVEAFRDAAKAVPHPDALEVRIEDSLPPFIETGELVNADGAMVAPFAKAAYALAKPGDTSGVVETEFGWHVIRLVERLPEQRMPFEARRAAFQDEVVQTRAYEALQQRLEALRAAAPVSIASDAEQLMRSVRASEP